MLVWVLAGGKNHGKFFPAFFTSADFFKINFFEKFFRNTITVSNSLDSDTARRFIGPDLGPNCLQKLSAEES